MSEYIIRTTHGKSVKAFHTESDCPAVQDMKRPQHVDEQYVQRRGLKLCKRCAKDTVYVKRHHVSTFHAEPDCKYLKQVESPREIAKETAQGFFDAEACSECSKQSNDHSYYNAAVNAGDD